MPVSQRIRVSAQCAVLSAALALSSLVTAGASHAGSERLTSTVFNASVAFAPDSAHLGAPALAQGRLLSPAGRPVVGAAVVLILEPSTTTLAKMTLGTTYRENVVSRGTTTSTGAWRLSAPDSLDLSHAVSPGNLVNFQVMSAGPNWAANSFFSGSVRSGSDGAGNTIRVRSAGQPRVLRPNPSAASIVLHARPATTRAVPTRAGNDVAPFACTTSYKADLLPRHSVVGEGFSDASSVSQLFTYHHGQSSQLGAAISYSGSSSGYAGNGTIGLSKTQSDSTSNTFKTIVGAVNEGYTSDFDYHQYYTFCNTSPSYYSAKPVSYAGGADWHSVGDVAMGKCVGYREGTSPTFSTSTASTISGGVEISAKIGIDLSAQTGYSSTASIRYSMGSTGHPVCGKNDYPGGKPGLIMVHSSVYPG